MSAPAPVPVLIADDHPIFRRGLREVIEEAGRYSVVAECANGEDAVFHCQNLRPSVAVLDMEMPRLGGIEVAVRLRDLPAPPAVLFLTMHDTEAIFHRAMEAGGLGYILKDDVSDEIIEGLDTLVLGRRYVSPSLKSRFLQPVKKDAPRDDADAVVAIASLTPAERRVLHLIAENRSTDEIASLLAISPRTVDGHRAHISRKLNLSGSYALVRFALLHRDHL